MEDINKIIGKNLSFLRKQAKLTQLELASKFNYSDKTISKWESGESLPSIDVLYELSKFYNVSLDDLTKEDETEISTTKQTTTEKINPKAYSSHIVIPLLAVSAVWLIATTLFVTLIITAKINYPLCFIWAIPVSCIVLIVFNGIWGKYRYLFMILTAMLWSILTAVHIQFLVFEINIWPIYLIGVPLQIAVMLWDALVRHPKWYIEQERLERKKNRLAIKNLRKNKIESILKEKEIIKEKASN